MAEMEDSATLQRAVQKLDERVPNPTAGLPDEVFYYISRTTPLINVDLLVKDQRRGLLLAWRDDPHTGKGWHIPGGIIRYKERIETRIQQVAESELGAQVEHDAEPLTIQQIIAEPKRDRAHFISLLYRCSVPDHYEIDNGEISEGEPGYLKWHRSCLVDDLLSWHEIYRPYLQLDEEISDE